MTVVEPEGPGHPLTVAITCYIPAIAAVAEAVTGGFCWDDVNPLGPVQAYVSPVIFESCK